MKIVNFKRIPCGKTVLKIVFFSLFLWREAAGLQIIEPHTQVNERSKKKKKNKSRNITSFENCNLLELRSKSIQNAINHVATQKSVAQ